MSRVRFLADHDLNDHLIGGLTRREPAIEVIRAREVNLQNRPDPELLDFAAVSGLLIISHDVNTMPAHAKQRIRAGLHHSGLLIVPQTRPIPPILDSLTLIWSASDLEEWRDRIMYLPF